MPFAELLTSAETENAFQVRLHSLPEDDEERHRQLVILAGEIPTVVQTLVGTGTTDVAFDDADFARTLLSLATLENVISGYTVLQAPLEFRQKDIPLWLPTPASLPLMRRLKESLDPNSVFNPGRFVGRI